ncbi:MAG: EscU/YscU/HrcU family type III secretion system export apparatus switch protein [Pseudomonadota bacterium]
MSEKEFPPSIKRLNKARKEGKIVKSQMVSVTAVWWAVSLAIIPALAWVRDGSLVQWLNYKVWTPQVALAEASWLGLKVISLLVGSVALSTMVVGFAQTKGLFLPSQLARGFEQYKPGAFIGRVKQQAIDSALGLLRCCVVIIVLLPVWTIISEVTPSPFIGMTEIAQLAISDLLKSVMTRGGVTLLVIAGVAYWLARWRFFRQQRMSLQDMKDEHKEDEGDPHAKSHRKHEHRAMLFSEVEKRVKRSKVVVVSRFKGGDQPS